MATIEMQYKCKYEVFSIAGGDPLVDDVKKVTISVKDDEDYGDEGVLMANNEPISAHDPNLYKGMPLLDACRMIGRMDDLQWIKVDVSILWSAEADAAAEAATAAREADEVRRAEAARSAEEEWAELRDEVRGYKIEHPDAKIGTIAEDLYVTAGDVRKALRGWVPPLPTEKAGEEPAPL